MLLGKAADVGGIFHPLHFLAVLDHQQGRGLADAVLLGQGGVLIHHHGLIADARVGQELLGHDALGAGGGGEEEEAGVGSLRLGFGGGLCAFQLHGGGRRSGSGRVGIALKGHAVPEVLGDGAAHVIDLAVLELLGLAVVPVLHRTIVAGNAGIDLGLLAAVGAAILLAGQIAVIRADGVGGRQGVVGQTGKALYLIGGKTANGTNVGQYGYSGTLNQRFYLVQSSATAHTYSNTYTIRAAGKTSLALDIVNASKDGGANARIYTYSGGAAQKFRLMYSGNGYYRIMNVNSGKVLGIKGDTNANGANVRQATWMATNGQRWKVVKNSDGSVTLQSALGTALDVYAGSMTPNANVDSWAVNKTTAQKWKLVKVS